MTKYVGVVTGQDFINFNGIKVPFWELLDKQPEIWLTSIAYYKGANSVPNTKIIFDCGAWTYRNDKYPNIKGKLLTPFNAYNYYKAIAKKGDICVVPDHMTIQDIDFRSRYNKRASEIFIKLYTTDPRKTFHPMAVVHGEVGKIGQYAKQVEELGYKYIAIGGLAAKANQITNNVEKIKEVKNCLSEKTHLHVLGLSALSYQKHLLELKIDTFDGSSYFKKAFTAGYFYGADMKIYKVPKLGGDYSNIPFCNCTACQKVRSVGQDTRSFGTRIRNLGRAAHNLNMFMENLII